MKLYKLLLLVLAALYQSHASAAVELPNGRIHMTISEMRIKTAGIDLDISRSWYSNYWYFNSNWQNLKMEAYPGTCIINSGESNRSGSGGDSSTHCQDISKVSYKSIWRGRYEYRNVGNNIYRYDERKQIVKTETGFTWKDKNGEWINYDISGKTLDFGYRNVTQGVIVRDDKSRIAGLTDTDGNQLLFIEYNDENRVIALRDNSSPARETRYIYDGERLIEAIDVLGNSYYYSYKNAANVMTSYSDAMGNKTTITYALNGRPESILDEQGIGWNYVFDYDKVRKSYYVRRSHTSGRIIETWYDKDAELLRQDINGENTKTITRNQYNTQDSITDRRNLKTIKDYDIHRNLIKTTYPDGSTTSQTVNSQTSNITQTTDENGIITQYRYNDNGYLIETIEAVGTAKQRHTHYQRNDRGQATQITQTGDANTAERIVYYQYDTAGNLTQSTDALGHITNYTYDNGGNRLSQTQYDDNNSAITTSYQYNGKGWLTKLTRPDGSYSQYQYDGNGNLLKQTDYDSNQNLLSEQSNQYDYRNNRIAHTNSIGGSTHYQYDSRDNLVKITDAAGNSQTLKYDLNNRITDRIDAAGHKTSYTYGDKGTITSGLLTQISYPDYSDNRSYDKRGRLLSKELKPHQNQQGILAQTTRYQYNAGGELTQSIDAKNRSTGYTYDALGRLTKTTDNEGKTTQYSYDNRDNLLSVTDANGHTIRTYQYDKENNNTKESKAPLQGQTASDSLSYNALGQLQSSTNALGQVTRYQYNSKGQLTQLQRFANNSTTTPGYSASFSYNEQGQLSGYSDNNSSASYQYNSNNQKTNETVNYTQGGFSKSYSYHYNTNGQKTRFTDAQNLAINYSYTPDQQIAQIHIADTGFLTYHYTNGQLDQLSLPGDSQQYFRYDALQRPQEILTQDPATIELDKRLYQYDTLNNIIKQSIREGELSYQYNNLDRLTDVNYQPHDNLTWDYNHNQSHPPINEHYSYDPVGNRLSSHKTDSTWQYNERNELQGYTEQSQNITYQYNANGQLIQKTQAAEHSYYEYNLAGRLQSIKDTNQNTIASYTYDPFGRRLSKTVYNHEETPATQTTTYFLYSDEGLIAEYNETGQLIQSYGYTPDSPFSTNPIFSHRPDFTDADGYVYYINDHLGTPKKLLTNTGRVVWFGESEAFGTTQLVKSEYRNPLRFPGQYFDEESGLHYNFHRYYEPELGRYITSDPIGLDGGINAFEYAGSSPIINFDSTGETPVHLLIFFGRLTWKIYKLYKKLPCVLYTLVDCRGNVVYVGISKAPSLRMYGHRSSRGVIGKYGCKDKEQCEIKMGLQGAYKSRSACKKAERRLIKKKKPIWNTQHNYDPQKQRKREQWRKKNCGCK